MSYDKIILFVVLLSLAGTAAFVEWYSRKKRKESGYIVEKVKRVNVATNIDIKNGNTYEKTYRYRDGKEVTIVEKSNGSSEKMAKILRNGKCKIFRNARNRDDILPYKNYLPITIGCIFMLIVEVYLELIR